MRVIISSLKAEIDSLKTHQVGAQVTSPPKTAVSVDQICSDRRDQSDPSDALKAAICKTLYDVNRRRKNVVITGLPESSDGLSDETIFSQFCEEHMTTKPSLSHLGCRRLGSLLNPPDLHRRPRRLLVHLNTEACAQELLKAAKNLRHSTDQTARSVYINRDLDPATAKLEYEKRVRRRQKQQQEQKQKQQQGNQCDRVSSHTACLSSVPPATSLSDFDTSTQTTADLGLGTSTLSSFQDSS